jgi:ubiquinone/menaquinone biosynthesis C-methylase UbiE
MAARRITLDPRTLEVPRFADRRVLEPEVMDEPGEVEAYQGGVATPHLERMDDTFVRSALRFARSGGRVLDVGSGSGAIAVKLALKRPDLSIVAIDLSDAMIRAARKAVREAGAHRRIRVRKANARRIPFPGASFDLVVSNSLLHHLPDPVPTFNEMARVLAPGGCVFIRDLKRPGPSRMKAHIRRHGRSYSGEMYRLFADSVRASFRLSEIRVLVEESALRECRVRPQFATYLVVEGKPGRASGRR